MSWLLRHNWLWSLIAFLIGAAITWILLERRQPATSPEPPGRGVGGGEARGPRRSRDRRVPTVARAEPNPSHEPNRNPPYARSRAGPRGADAGPRGAETRP